ncbi:hypothetical protein BIY26_23415 [Brenneria goodwinii]|uniref:Uncharacterized protein n=1 Tax=Brenneria goodwinii TaxID=1109412 RepID=A0AAE8JKY8_9GAMM|nr:hypothetical protein AWC36_04015 [Brenneria goodwinii]RLM14163.1 hypothetical protein BIY26_23415 [Brenneria goodwinii]
MKYFNCFFAMVVFFLSISLGVNYAQANQNPSRIYPNTLRSYTPEDAVNSFIEAYKCDDFYEVWHRFTRDAKKKDIWNG